MNYYQARQRKDGRWYWTCQNDGEIWAAPPCDQKCGHASKEEAERHFYDDQVSRLEAKTWKIWKPCRAAGCQELTNQTFGPPDDLRLLFLCDKHRTEASYRELVPFRPGLSVMSSW